MKSRFTDDRGTDRPITGIKMGRAAHEHPSGLTLNESQARSRHRWNESTRQHRAEAAQAAGATSATKNLSQQLADLAYTAMDENPRLDFGAAMRVVLSQRPDLGRAYRLMSAPAKPPTQGAAPPLDMDDADFCEMCNAPINGDKQFSGKTGVQPRLSCPGCSAPIAYGGGLRVQRGHVATLDEGSGDADSIGDGESLEEDDVQPVVNDIAARDSFGAPVVLKELQQKIRRDQRRRANSARPII